VSQNSRIPPETDAEVVRWMNGHGWKVGPAVRRQEPEGSFYVWQEDGGHVTSHSLWVAEEMTSKLKADELISVFKRERLAEDIRISFRIRIEERGTEYRVSLVPRRSGEFRAQE
jgi:hypothetical protein